LQIHIRCADDEAKFRLEPQIELAKNDKLSRIQFSEIEEIIKASLMS